MKKSGLIISEYPMHVKPLAYHFPWRNRLIAALSSNLVVIEATYKSGTMITVNECLELSVPIYGKLHFHPKYWRYIVNIDFANKQ